MKNPYLTETDFRQTRDFGGKISATFEFIAAHFQPLGKCLIYIVLPWALLSGIGIGLVQTSFLNLFDSHSAVRASAGMTSAAIGGISGLITGVAYILVSGVVYCYIRLRLVQPPSVVIEPGMVWRELQGRLLPMLGYGLLLGLIIGLASLVLAIPGIYLFVASSLFYSIYFVEDTSFGDTLSRMLSLIRHYWWQTVALLIVMGLIRGVLGFVFQIPQVLVVVAQRLHWGFLGSDVIIISAQCFATLGIVFLYVPGVVVNMFQYFHLAEEKDGLGMRHLINQLGQAAPVVADEHLRPDDEGEY